MNFRNQIMLILFILIIINVNATEISLNKISEFSFSEKYNPVFMNRNLVAQENILYTLNYRSLQAFEIQEDSLNKIMDYNIKGVYSNLCINNDYAYVGKNDKLLRINLNNFSHPYIEDSLSYQNYGVYFTYDDYIVVNESNNYNVYNHIYDNETFELLTTYSNIDNYLIYLDDNLAYTRDNSNDSTHIDFYNISDPLNINKVGSGSTEKLCLAPHSLDIIQDSVFVVMDPLEGILFYDISEPYNWELISNINVFSNNMYIYGEKLVVNLLEQGEINTIALYDISNITNPQLLDTVHPGYIEDFVDNLEGTNNKLFTTTRSSGQLIYYDISSQSFYLEYSYSSEGIISDSYMCNNNLYLLTRLKGIKQWDISNINNSQFINTYSYHNLSNYITYLLRGDENILVETGIKTLEEVSIANTVFNITQNGNLTKLDPLIVPYYSSAVRSILAYKDNIGFFICHNNHLYKYVLNENNKFDRVADIQVPISSAHIHFPTENIAYIFGAYEMGIVNNIQNNEEMSYITTISNEFYQKTGDIKFYDNYMFISEPANPGCAVYNISDPLNPTQFLNIPHNYRIGIDNYNDLLFLGHETTNIYDLSDISIGQYPLMNEFQNWSYVSELKPFRNESENYLMYVEQTSASIYHYTANSVEEEFNYLNKPFSINSPNPFTTTTTISFTTKKPISEDQEIEIFNIRGQKVQTLTVDQNGTTENGMLKYITTWDGTNKHGNRVSQGVYFYKIETSEKTMIEKMVLVE